MTIAELVRKMRDHYSRTEFAEKVGTSRKYVEQIENGHCNTKVKTLQNWAMKTGWKLTFDLELVEEDIPIGTARPTEKNVS